MPTGCMKQRCTVYLSMTFYALLHWQIYMIGHELAFGVSCSFFNPHLCHKLLYCVFVCMSLLLMHIRAVLDEIIIIIFISRQLLVIRQYSRHLDCYYQCNIVVGSLPCYVSPSVFSSDVIMNSSRAQRHKIFYRHITYTVIDLFHHFSAQVIVDFIKDSRFCNHL